jgi:putative SOS response-associated peptidase YedK
VAASRTQRGRADRYGEQPMCGRFVSTSPPDEIAKYFGATEVQESSLEPSYNVAPTDDVYVVLESGGVRRVEPLHWGLIPFWAKDAKIGNRMINARAETVATTNAFRHAFEKRRCIVPADGFYEWTKRTGKQPKQPWFVHRPDGEPIALAGLWEVWRPKGPAARGEAPGAASIGSDDELHSFTILTGEPNEKMAEIHDRMPVMLPPDAWDDWLDPDQQDTDLLGKLLVPAPSALITFHPVSTEVNNVRNGGEHLIDPIELDDDEPT